MPEELYPNLFRIKIPLPESPLKYLNSYIIKGDNRSLVVDTGMKHPVCRTAMLNGLKALSIPLSTVDFFITHFHEDHFGLIGELLTQGCKVYFNRPDMKSIERLQSLEPLIQAAVKNGYPEDQLRHLFAQRPGIDYGNKWMSHLHFLHDNDLLEIGDYRFVCIHTPGHSAGHICLYESEKKFLISGDHVLNDISPNITCWYDDMDPLKDYLESLDKIYPLEIDRVLPGHRLIFTDIRQRIDGLKHHHMLRLTEITGILQQKASSLSAFEIASEMKWDITADSWEDYPWFLKFFATGEANTHLRYLENSHVISCDSNGDMRTYSYRHDPLHC
ncbi:MAG: MBL fold metallo-hydrolase [Desulfobacterales bacterium]|jgi:glyoxylase-like metal-dependent hydrolase (beta-lactamase superfamily II)|nr:MBL fold metallo-hydrolase [Desulfobacterales bacterium]